MVYSVEKPLKLHKIKNEDEDAHLQQCSSSIKSTTRNSTPEIIDDEIEDVENVVVLKASTSSDCQVKTFTRPPSCLICGDAATGHHYEVPSCNGCKTFFRRTVISEKLYKCKREGKCFENVEAEHRCTCRACRFKQCVKVGMNPLAIQMDVDPESNVVVKSIVAKRKSPKEDQLPKPDTQISLRLHQREQKMERILDGLLYVETKNDTLRKSTYNPREFKLTLKDILNTSSNLSIADQLLPMPDWPLPIRNVQFNDPSDFEWNRKHWLFFDILTSIDYAKTFPFYSRLKEHDKEILMKKVTLMCSTFTEAFYSYQREYDTLVFPDGMTPAVAFKEELSELARKMFSESISLLHQLKPDRKEYVLVKAIMLCNSALGGLSRRGAKIIEESRNEFTYSLFSYVLAKYGIANAPRRFQELISLIATFIGAARIRQEFYVFMKLCNLVKVKFALVGEIMES